MATRGQDNITVECIYLRAPTGKKYIYFYVVLQMTSNPRRLKVVLKGNVSFLPPAFLLSIILSYYVLENILGNVEMYYLFIN